jgi:Ricin-type beta-trefoil lectin domain
MAQNKLRRVLFALLAPLLVLALPGTATAATEPSVYYTPWITDASIYEMRASYSWGCMDVKGESQSPGATIQRFDCKGKLHQRFYFTRSTTPGLFMIHVYGSYCIGTQNAQGAVGTPIVLGYCQGPGQLFRWADGGSNHWEIVEAASGKCLMDRGRAQPITLGTCGNLTEPYPSLWTPLYKGQYNYTSLNG